MIFLPRHRCAEATITPAPGGVEGSLDERNIGAEPAGLHIYFYLEYRISFVWGIKLPEIRILAFLQLIVSTREGRTLRRRSYFFFD